MFKDKEKNIHWSKKCEMNFDFIFIIDFGLFITEKVSILQFLDL